MFPFAPPHTRWTAPPTAGCWESHVPPIAIFSRMGGVEEALFDDFRNSLTQGEHTYLCFMHTFDVTESGSVLRALSALEWTMKLAVLSDLVLQGMNWDTSRDHRFDTRIRTHAEKVQEYHARRANNTERPPAR